MKINLRDYYPNLKHDCCEDVPDEIVELLNEFKSNDATDGRKKRDKNKNALSLDCEAPREGMFLVIDISPESIYEQKMEIEHLYEALNRLDPIQRDRIKAYYILGYTETEIAMKDDVSQAVISIAIKRGLKKLRDMLNA